MRRRILAAISSATGAIGFSMLLLAAPPAAAASHHHRHHHARHHARPVVGDPAPVWSDFTGTWRQSGIASWYGGPRWQGHPTFSGAPFNEHALTAAHATLPMGTKVRVIVRDTGRSVVVTINDRPGTRRRIIDLSRAAAKKLGILDRGIAPVTLLPVRATARK